MATEKRDAQLLELVEPQFITMTKQPANKTGFKVLRSADAETADYDSKDSGVRRRKKAKRGDENLIAIELPLGITQEEAQNYMDKYSLGEDYFITGDEDSGFVLKRADADSTAEVVRIDLGNDVVALVAASSFKRSDTKITGITLVGVEFANSFDEKSAQAWLDEHEIAYRDNGLSTENGLCTAVRYEVPENQEVRRVDIEEDVTGLVARTESIDIPEKVYRSVIEEAYGSWGWGSLDFSQAVADAEFTELARDAIWVLYDVLDNILFYSYLPIDERKTLVRNACDQFSNYIGSLIDALPREVAQRARADKSNVNQETNDMAHKDEKGKDTQRTDKSAETEGKKPEVTEETEATETPNYVTREDIEGILSEHFSPDKIKDMFGAAIGMKRADEEQEEVDPTLKAIQELTASVTAVADKVSGMEETQKTMRSDLDEIGGTTHKRTDEEEAETDAEQGEKVKREDESVFSNIFNFG